MSSPPETPQGKNPKRKSEYRFDENDTACEWGEQYHPGGYHPVHIQDVFNNRYRVIRKLGYGAFSTVWLAIDLRSACYVALKILTATLDQQQAVLSECVFHDRLVANKPYPQHIVSLLDSFHHYGPNGKHLCLVYEAMGPDVDLMIRLSPQCRIGEPWERRLPKQWARRVLRDALLGLQSLHANGIVHGDFHLGNILFTIKLPSLESAPPERLQQHPEEYNWLRRLDGKADLWAPKYILEPKSLYDYTSLELDPLVKVADLGGAFLQGSPPPTIVTPAALRSPELVLGGQVDTGLDIWSFGCLVFELVTGQQLFYVERLGGNRLDEITNDEHLIQITEVIQPLPEALFNKWSRARMYYGPDGERLDTHDDVDDLDAGSDKEQLDIDDGDDQDAGSDDEQMDIKDALDEMSEEDGPYHERDSDSQSQVSLASPRRFDSLENRFRAVKPANIDEREEEEILRLIRLALQPDAAKRASAAQLLQQAWFREW